MNDVNIKLTENAKQHIRRVMSKDTHAIGLRLAVRKTGCSGYAYVADIAKEKQPGDIYCELEDITVLVDQASVSFLKGTEIDFVDEGMGQTKLLFNNPNVANHCGCGESFTLADE